MRAGVLGLAVGALLLAACPAGGDAPPTPSPDPTSPSPTATAAGGPCEELGPGQDVALPVLFVTSPDIGAAVTSPVTVTGCTNTFEAAFSWELVAADGTELAAGNEMATCGSGCLGTFSFPVSFDVDQERIATLRVFSLSPRDGSVQELNALPLRLRP